MHFHKGKIKTKGSIYLPADVREDLALYANDEVAITTSNNSIVIKKHTPLCCICNGSKKLKSFKGRHICLDCIDGL